MITITRPRHLLRLALLTLAALGCSLLQGCRHKDLCYHHLHVVKLDLIFDWRDAPDATCKGMSVYFFPDDPASGLEVKRFDFMDNEGGEISLPAGDYHILCHNLDTDVIDFRGPERHNTYEAYTRDGGIFEPVGIWTSSNKVPRAKDAEYEQVSICPEQLWGCSATSVKVTPQGVSYICIPESEKEPWLGLPPVVTRNTITLYPHDLMCHYTYEIRNVSNIDLIDKMSASLSGMSSSLFIFGESLGYEGMTLPFAARKSDDGRIVGEFLTFGHHPDNPTPHRLMLYVWHKDGRQLVYGTTDRQWDVTDQVHTAPDRRHVHLIVDGLDIPDPIGPGSGEGDEGAAFQPDIDDWWVVNVDISM